MYCCQVVFYDNNGREIQAYDYSGEDAVREFTSCSFNPSGDTAIFGTYNRFYIYTFNAMRRSWDEVRMQGGCGPPSVGAQGASTGTMQQI